MRVDEAGGFAIRLGSSSFPFFALLYLALFAAFRTESPFFPSFLAGRGLSPGEIGTVLAAGTLVRLATGPLLGIAADRHGRRSLLALTSIGSGTIILLYLVAAGFSTLLLISMAHAVMIAPLTPLADALCVTAAKRENVFSYGSVRGLGSAGFILGTMASGVVVATYGLDSIIVAAAVLFVLMAAPVPWLPPYHRNAAPRLHAGHQGRRPERAVRDSADALRHLVAGHRLSPPDVVVRRAIQLAGDTRFCSWQRCMRSRCP